MFFSNRLRAWILTSSIRLASVAQVFYTTSQLHRQRQNIILVPWGTPNWTQSTSVTQVNTDRTTQCWERKCFYILRRKKKKRKKTNLKLSWLLVLWNKIWTQKGKNNADFHRTTQKACTNWPDTYIIFIYHHLPVCCLIQRLTLKIYMFRVVLLKSAFSSIFCVFRSTFWDEFGLFSGFPLISYPDAKRSKGWQSNSPVLIRIRTEENGTSATSKWHPRFAIKYKHTWWLPQAHV